MAIELRVRHTVSRSFVCDVSGCRNKTRNLISKRQDVASHPLHICDDCIKGIYAIVAAREYASRPAEVSVPQEAEVEPTAAVTEPVAHHEPKAEPKPNKARKGTKK